MNTQAIKRPVDSVIATVTILVMVTLVVCVVWQVFSRYVLNQPSTLTDEMARFSMIWVGLLGAAYTVGAQRHLSIDLFTLEMKGKMRFFNQLTINAAILCFALSVMVIGGLRLVDKVFSTGQISPAMEIPMGYVYAVLPLSGLIITFYCALFIADEIKNLAKVKLANSSSNREEKA
jgi:TRAP-type C4-dicarboxylate transport system permease small subunit